jgi:aspartyl-tRNA(Asn)/glutamyl-tRNA(Gln) amidotransferase subunit B
VSRTEIDTRETYEAVIGIECHVELKTASKMFCSCANVFGGEPNTKICPVCLALPGALPVPNAAAILHVIRAGLAVGSGIPAFSKFDRKNYFYPDMPKNYQISQFDMPLTQGGIVEFWLADGTRKRCRLTRIHLEEDTGKLTHAGNVDGRLAGSSSSLVDFNRAGVPLMECVSEPDLRSAEEAVGFLEALKRLFVLLGVSDVKMEEGSLRCDANVSIRPRGADELGTKTEIKNLNSFRSVSRAIDSEIARQVALVQSGRRIVQETRGWNETEGRTHSQRSKELAHDYRYFPDPDLTPMRIDPREVAEMREALPMLPHERFDLYVGLHGLSVAAATQIIDTPGVADYVDAVIEAGATARMVANFVLADCSRLANETETPIGESRLKPAALAEIIALVEAGKVGSKIAKELLTRIWGEGGSARAIVEREGLAQVSDPAEIERLVLEVMEANAQSVSDYRAGKENALKFLLGQVMKRSRGKADPTSVEARLRVLLAPSGDDPESQHGLG